MSGRNSPSLIDKKEAIGWSVGSAHYRVRRRRVALLLAMVDTIGGILSFMRKRRPPASPRSILIIQLDHIGDMILCTPLIDAVKKNWPGARISLLIRTLADPVAKTIEGVAALHLHTPWLSREKNIGWMGVMEFCLRRFRRYDLQLRGSRRGKEYPCLLGFFRSFGSGSGFGEAGFF